MARDKLRGLDLNLLVTLDAALRCRSVTKAAEYLDLTQGAVSQALGRHAPRLHAWLERMHARAAVQAALAMPNKVPIALRKFSASLPD